MKKWKIIRVTTITLLILFVAYVVIDAVICTQMTYPHPMLGVDAHNWVEQFKVDLALILFVFGIPLIIDIIILIVSIIKINKYKNGKK